MKFNNRLYGIDLLKIVAMLLIVTLHVIINGGIVSNTDPLSINGQIVGMMEIVAYIAVNLYALISGYLAFGSKIKYERIVELWIQVFFYGVIIFIIANLITPERVTLTDLKRAVTPVTSVELWYFTAYFGVFLCKPVLDIIVQNSDKRTANKFFLTVLITFTGLSTFLHSDCFYLKGGYSFLWISMLYIIGGFLRKYHISEGISTRKAILIYVLNIFVLYTLQLIIQLLTVNFFGEVRYDKFFLSYVSPFVFVSAIMIFVIFCKIDIKTQRVQKLISIISSATFGVYAIHVNPIIFGHVLRSRFKGYAASSPIVMVLQIIVTVLAIYAICTVADLIRIKLFKLAKADALAKHLVSWIKKIYNKISVVE